MLVGDSTADSEFRDEIRTWMHENLTGDFAKLRFRGGPGDEHMFVQERMEWERHLASARWTCVGWPTQYGGRGLPISQEVIFHEEYARAGGPGRAGLIGEGLLGPTLIHFASEEQKAQFLPGIVGGTEYWCQGYSEPNAGSDLANIKTTARLEGEGVDGQWVINGQKVWTSLAQWSDWCFVIARAEEGSQRHAGLVYLLVPMTAEGIEVRPIRQITGTAEFNEVFFDDVRTDASNIVGGIGDGWKVAMGTLAFERGVLTLGQQMAFQRELTEIIDAAKANGRLEDPNLRDAITSLWIRVRIMRANAVRTLSLAESQLGREAMITKLFWASLHRDMGEVAMDAMGSEAMIINDSYDSHEPLEALHRLFMFTRSDTIYGGSNQVQRNVIGERALGLPREPR
ncbi:MAG TPA: acyl-CoA dehydrogenase family protein [Microthrixaceae bacterium]|nr:acyl-CoA dehydrogenase family protein [Microthrixaceae bacterium]